MNRLPWNLSANIVSSVWLTIVALVVTPLYVSFLGVESYGLIGFYASWVAILGILDTGISATAVRETAWLSARPETKCDVPSLLRSLEIVYWSIILTIGAGLLLGAWLFGAQWFPATSIPPDTIREAMLLMVVSLVVQIPSGLYAAGLMGLQRQVDSSALAALFGTARSVGAIAVLSLGGADVRMFFVWQIVVSALQTGAMRWAMTRRVRTKDHPARFSKRLLRSVTRFAGGMTLVTALGVMVIQMDKMILSRMASLEAFGLYMLAWTVASALLRIAAPLLQAFNPRFTELVSKGDEEALARQVRLANQLMSALLLPPAALLAVLSRPILMAWTGEPAVAAGAAPLLSVLVVGTLLNACSYPSLSVLYSRKRLRPVIVVNLTAVILLLPLVTEAIRVFGAVGAASCWVLYGLVTYVAYQKLGLQGLPRTAPLWSVLRDFVAPGLVSFGVAAVTWRWATQVEGRTQIIVLVGAALVVGWAAAVVVCRDLYAVTLRTFRSNPFVARWSA